MNPDIEAIRAALQTVLSAFPCKVLSPTLGAELQAGWDALSHAEAQLADRDAAILAERRACAEVRTKAAAYYKTTGASAAWWDAQDDMSRAILARGEGGKEA